MWVRDSGLELHRSMFKLFVNSAWSLGSGLELNILFLLIIVWFVHGRRFLGWNWSGWCSAACAWRLCIASGQCACALADHPGSHRDVPGTPSLEMCRRSHCRRHPRMCPRFEECASPFHPNPNTTTSCAHIRSLPAVGSYSTTTDGKTNRMA